jgi:hypothetical protein
MRYNPWFVQPNNLNMHCSNNLNINNTSPIIKDDKTSKSERISNSGISASKNEIVYNCNLFHMLSKIAM